MTYGAYQELASTGLRLALAEFPPASPRDAAPLLHYRGQVLDTLTERLTHLGAGQSLEAPLALNARTTHVSVARRPLRHLQLLLAQFRRTPDEWEVSPSDLLSQDATGPASSWQTAARNLFLATSELVRADDRPWVDSASAAWPLVSDLADCIQAVILADARWAEAGLVHDRASERTPRLLVAADIGRLARLAATDTAADAATAGWRADVCSSPDILMVRGVGDLAGAQHRLAALVRLERRELEDLTPQVRPGLRVARAVAAGQVGLAELLGRWAREAGAAPLGRSSQELDRSWRALHASTVRMVDAVPHRSLVALMQQSEISTFLRSRRSAMPTLPVPHLRDLDTASREVARSIGRTLLHEGIKRHNFSHRTYAADASIQLEPLTADGGRFEMACRALTSLASFTELATDPPSTAERSRLRHALYDDKLPYAYRRL